MPETSQNPPHSWMCIGTSLYNLLHLHGMDFALISSISQQFEASGTFQRSGPNLLIAPSILIRSAAEMKIKDNRFRPFQRFNQSLWWIYPELLVHCPIVQNLKIVQRSLPDMAQSAELILRALYKQPFETQRWRMSSIWCFCVQPVNKIQICSNIRHGTS